MTVGVNVTGTVILSPAVRFAGTLGVVVPRLNAPETLKLETETAVLAVKTAFWVSDWEIVAGAKSTLPAVIAGVEVGRSPKPKRLPDLVPT
jgi:hypothetical protein